MANTYLGQKDEYSEPSKLQQVMKAISERMLRAAAGGGDRTAYSMLPEQQALQEREMKLKEREQTSNEELKRLALGMKNPVGNLTPAQTMADKRFAQDYADYNLKGGAAGVQRQLSQLNDVANALDSGEITTGTLPGASIASSWIGSIANPKLMAARQAVENAVQSTLRQTLGAQFTEKEGKMMLERSFDPKLPPQENAKKLRNTINELNNIVAAKEAAGQHYEQYGTLKNFKGTQSRGGGSSGKIIVSNGKNSFAIDASDLAEAQRDGFQVVK